MKQEHTLLCLAVMDISTVPRDEHHRELAARREAAPVTPQELSERIQEHLNGSMCSTECVVLEERGQHIFIRLRTQLDCQNMSARDHARSSNACNANCCKRPLAVSFTICRQMSQNPWQTTLKSRWRQHHCDCSDWRALGWCCVLPVRAEPP